MSVQNYTDNAINVCLPSTYAFAEKVVYELQQMYRAAGLKLTTFHMGGDEVGKGSWEQSPACKTLFAKGEQGVTGVADLKPYFVSKIAAITHARGLYLAGWEDGLMYDAANTFNRKQFANEKVYANAWDNIWEWGVADRAYRLANAGYQVILSPGTHLYFDHPYETNAEERGFYWATRYSDTAKVFGFMPDNYYANADKTREGAPITNLEALVGRELPKLNKPENLAGIQGQLWSETIRTPEQLEQMIYPRVMALAERAWHKADWEADQPNTQKRLQDWANFSAALAAKDLPKLAVNGAAFYLPPPGAIIQNGQLLANVGYAGLAIEYSLDQGATWSVYQGPVTVSVKSAQVRSRLAERHSRVTTVD
jgi:hexosaminidase